MLLLRHQDGYIYREEQEADEHAGDPVHDGLLADGSLCVRHPHRRHQGHPQQRQQKQDPVPKEDGRHHQVHERQQGIQYAFSSYVKK